MKRKKITKSYNELDFRFKKVANDVLVLKEKASLRRNLSLGKKEKVENKIN